MKSTEMHMDKTYTGQGTCRSCPPTETLDRLRPRLREFGITRVANVTGLDIVGIPVVMVVRPNGYSLSVTQGKGYNLELAKASGIMEAVEHHCAERCSPRELRLAEIADAVADGAIDPQLWPSGTEPRSARQRVVWTRTETLNGTPGPWVPFDMVHLDLRVDHPLSHDAFPVTSNGLAAGNCRSEAVVHGALELIERDALALFYQRTAREQLARRVAPSSVTSNLDRSLLERFEAAGLTVGIWDVTSDLGIATFLVATLEGNPNPLRRTGVALGAGAHLERDVALARALCEAAQSRLTRIAGVRDDIGAEEFDSVRSRESERRWRTLLAEPTGMRSFCQVPDWQYGTFDAELEHLGSALGKAELGPILTVDLAPDAEHFAVVRVLVPGLEGNYEFPGYRPGVRARRLVRSAA